jgi:hypothetical protein
LKEIVATTLGISITDLEDAKNNKLPVDIGGVQFTDCRKLLQVFGTEAMKPWFGKNVWADLFIKLDIKDKPIIISDWRFPEEFNVLSKYYRNIVTVRVLGATDNSDKHPSETSLDAFPFDYVLDNSKKDEGIKEVVRKFVRTINEKS